MTCGKRQIGVPKTRGPNLHPSSRDLITRVLTNKGLPIHRNSQKVLQTSVCWRSMQVAQALGAKSFSYHCGRALLCWGPQKMVVQILKISLRCASCFGSLQGTLQLPRCGVPLGFAASCWQECADVRSLSIQYTQIRGGAFNTRELNVFCVWDRARWWLINRSGPSWLQRAQSWDPQN